MEKQICSLNPNVVANELDFLSQIIKLRNENKLLREDLDEFLRIKIANLQIYFNIDFEIEIVNEYWMLFNMTIF